MYHTAHLQLFLQLCKQWRSLFSFCEDDSNTFCSTLIALYSKLTLFCFFIVSSSCMLLLLIPAVGYCGRRNEKFRWWDPRAIKGPLVWSGILPGPLGLSLCLSLSLYIYISLSLSLSLPPLSLSPLSVSHYLSETTHALSRVSPSFCRAHAYWQMHTYARMRTGTNAHLHTRTCTWK